jgi:hypothetical protein
MGDNVTSGSPGSPSRKITNPVLGILTGTGSLRVTAISLKPFCKHKKKPLKGLFAF